MEKKLFAEISNSKSNVDLGPFEISGFEWEKYIFGYETAIRLLRNELDKEIKNNSLIFPIVFLYRHLIELLIKNVIAKSNEALHNSKEVPHHHRLNDLWIELKTLLQELGFEYQADKMEIVEIENMLKEFDLFDRNSSGFRYPINKNGNLHFESGKKINIDVFLKNIHEVKLFFSALYIGFLSLSLSEAQPMR